MRRAFAHTKLSAPTKKNRAARTMEIRVIANFSYFSLIEGFRLQHFDGGSSLLKFLLKSGKVRALTVPSYRHPLCLRCRLIQRGSYCLFVLFSSTATLVQCL